MKLTAAQRRVLAAVPSGPDGVEDEIDIAIATGTHRRPFAILDRLLKMGLVERGGSWSIPFGWRRTAAGTAALAEKGGDAK